MHLDLAPMWFYCTIVLPLATMPSWRESFLLSLVSLLFLGGVAVGSVIAWAAWSGWPRSFDRGTWWTVFMLCGIPGVFLVIFAQRMEPAAAWQNFVQHVLFTLGILLVFIAWGCGLAVLTYRRRTPPISN